MKYTFLPFILVLCFFNQKVSAQEDQVWKEFEEANGHCSTHLTLYEDKTYLFETGCEQRSNINYGTWKMDNPYLHLTPQKKSDSFEFSEKPYEDKEDAKITVLDQSGMPISGFDLIQFDTRIPIEDVIEEAELKVNSTGELGLSEIYSAIDTYEGSTRISVQEGQLLFLFDLYQVTGEKITFSPDALRGKHLTLKVDFPSTVYTYPALSWYQLPSQYILIEGDSFFFVEGEKD